MSKYVDRKYVGNILRRQKYLTDNNPGWVTLTTLIRKYSELLEKLKSSDVICDSGQINRNETSAN